eukprot:scaffold2261_cov130-Isochrysis_galbana.AAC.4
MRAGQWAGDEACSCSNGPARTSKCTVSAPALRTFSTSCEAEWDRGHVSEKPRVARGGSRTGWTRLLAVAPPPTAAHPVHRYILQPARLRHRACRWSPDAAHLAEAGKVGGEDGGCDGVLVCHADGGRAGRHRNRAAAQRQCQGSSGDGQHSCGSAQQGMWGRGSASPPRQNVAACVRTGGRAAPTDLSPIWPSSDNGKTERQPCNNKSTKTRP